MRTNLARLLAFLTGAAPCLVYVVLSGHLWVTYKIGPDPAWVRAVESVALLPVEVLAALATFAALAMPLLAVVSHRYLEITEVSDRRPPSSPWASLPRNRPEEHMSGLQYELGTALRQAEFDFDELPASMYLMLEIPDLMFRMVARSGHVHCATLKAFGQGIQLVTTYSGRGHGETLDLSYPPPWITQAWEQWMLRGLGRRGSSYLRDYAGPVSVLVHGERYDMFISGGEGRPLTVSRQPIT